MSWWETTSSRLTGRYFSTLASDTPHQNTHQGKPSRASSADTSFPFPFAARAPAMSAAMALAGAAEAAGGAETGSSTSMGSVMVVWRVERVQSLKDVGHCGRKGG